MESFINEYDIVDLLDPSMDNPSQIAEAQADGIKMQLSHIRGEDRYTDTIVFKYINARSDNSRQQGFSIRKEDIAEYAKITETDILITPKRFSIDREIYDNKTDDDKIWTFRIILSNSSDTNKLKEFLDIEPGVIDATNTTDSTIDRTIMQTTGNSTPGGGKIMKYKLNKKKSILSNRLSKRRKTSKRRKISKRRNTRKIKKISKRRNKSKRYQ